jgi:DNA polymerase-2
MGEAMTVNSVVAFPNRGETSVKIFRSDRRVTYETAPDPYMFIETKWLSDVEAEWGEWGLGEYKLNRIERNAAVTPTGNDATQLFFDAPKCVSNFRHTCEAQGIPTFEADIPYRRRWLFAKRPQIGPYKPLYWDIECDSRLGFQDPARIQGEDLGRIIAIGGVGVDGGVKAATDASEAELITGFFDWARDRYGVLVGWNTEYFDVPYVQARARALGLRSPFHGFESFDLLKLYARIKSPESLKLTSVAKYELGHGKTEEFESRQRARDLWDSFVGDQKALTEYNINDCELVRGIDAKYKFVEAHEEVATMSSSTIGDTVYAGRVVDANVMLQAMDRQPRLALPTKQREMMYERDEEPVAGGKVFNANRGFYNRVAMVDFRSMYPSIIRAFNISLETASVAGTKHTLVLNFLEQPRAVTALALERLLGVRMRERALKATTIGAERILHKSRDDILKQILNSFYGTMASPYSRYYKPEVANSVTLTGQYLINTLATTLKAAGFFPFYGDTDSLFFTLPDEFTPIDIETMTTAWVREEVKKMGGDANLLEVECQYIFSKFILTDAKKRYFGVTEWVGHTKERKEVVMGFEVKKKNVTTLQKEVEKSLFNIIVTAADEPAAYTDALAYLKQIQRELYCGQHDEKLVLKLHMMKNRDDYDGEPMHVRAADLLPEDLQLSPGDVVRYTVIDVDDAGKPVVVPILNNRLPSFERGGYDYIFTHYILPMAKRIFPDLNDNLSQTKLEAWG